VIAVKGLRLDAVLSTALLVSPIHHTFLKGD
jgi:hypothetical protein